MPCSTPPRLPNRVGQFEPGNFAVPETAWRGQPGKGLARSTAPKQAADRLDQAEAAQSMRSREQQEPSRPAAVPTRKWPRAIMIPCPIRSIDPVLPRAGVPAAIDPWRCMNRVRLLVFNAGARRARLSRSRRNGGRSRAAWCSRRWGRARLWGLSGRPDRLPGGEVPRQAAPAARSAARSAAFRAAAPPDRMVRRLLLSRRFQRWRAWRWARGGAARRRHDHRIPPLRAGARKRLTPQRAAAMDALHGEQASIRELAEDRQRLRRRSARHGRCAGCSSR
jgi:hypothetical protein